MARERFCKVCRKWHSLSEPWPAECIPVRTGRSDLAAPMVIIDTMDPVQSMLDGKMYDSKSRLRRTYKEAGMIEVGNETPKPMEKPKPDRKAIKAAVRKAASRVGLGA